MFLIGVNGFLKEGMKFSLTANLGIQQQHKRLKMLRK
jgi:hypothetical protein